MSEQRHIEGFEVPIHRSLTEPILLAGLPRNVALVLWETKLSIEKLQFAI